MSSEQIILTATDYLALGEAGEAIPAKSRRAIHPMALTDGTFALAPVALQSATAAQVRFLNGLPRRQVGQSEFQWFADAEAAAAEGAK